MASMQIVGGGNSASPGKGAATGGIDPLLMGVSPEVAAAAGPAGEGSPQENPFASELAAALASLDAEQAAALAESLLDGALQNGQVIDPAALAQVTGQNLPIDPAFQNAILASFAALSGAVQSGLAADAVSASSQADAAVAAALTIDSANLVSSAAEIDTAAAVVATGIAAANGAAGQQAAATATNGLAMGAQAGGSVTGDDNKALLAAQAQGAGVAKESNAQQANAQARAQALQSAPDQVHAAAQQTKTQTSEQSVDAKTNSSGVTVLATQQAVSTTAQGQQSKSDSQSSSSQDQAQSAAALAEANRIRADKESSEYSGKQTTMAGTAANDLGNIVVTAKPNTEAVSASAEAARQSAQRIDGAAAANASSSASAVSQSADAAARAESRLEAARASLGSGPLNVEVLKLTRQGGGRAVLEVTPPNQGPIRIDLQLDGAGRASLVVEGLTDSMKARLESSAHFLRQDMASMGLALNLEMRERNDSNAQAQAFGQGQFGQSRQQDREAVAGPAQALRAGQASGNIPAAQRSTVTDDGIHLVA